ncbi:hypothetical protein NLJ89_g8164 [Agrocybe chaxingu]|uniref:Uncharacterized protein n=1 Tax=Agrocybe chaxingu TaxID=84603 RepID=A0A9W8JV89_9AGAR|nr:hypothetical protein NLJ89_g8164 [Agrocybe chaxingu]
MVCGNQRSDNANVMTVVLTPPSPAKPKRGVPSPLSSSDNIKTRDIEEAGSTQTSDAESSRQFTDPV